MKKAHRMRATFTWHLDTHRGDPVSQRESVALGREWHQPVTQVTAPFISTSAPQEEQPVHGSSQSKPECRGSGCQIPGQMPSQSARVGIRSVCPPGGNKRYIVYRNKKTAVIILRANLLFLLTTGNSLKLVENTCFVLVCSLNLILKLN